MKAVEEGEEIERFVRAVYPSLREIAGHLLQRERPNHTLRPTALVHEALIRLWGKKSMQEKTPAHMLAIAARQMRRVLIDYGRRKATKKRFGELKRVPLEDNETAIWNDEPAKVALLQALERLGRYDKRALRVVELKWLAGCTNKETAAVLGVSDGTVEAVWLHARLWLYRELTGGPLAEVVHQKDVRVGGVDLGVEERSLIG